MLFKRFKKISQTNITECYKGDVSKSYLLILPFKGKRRKTLCKITKESNNVLFNKHKEMLVYTDTKLSTNFNIKDIQWILQRKIQQQQDL